MQLIGYLPLSELVILLLTPFLLPRMTTRESLRPTRLLLPLAALWLLGTIVSDVINETQWSLAARGLARPIAYIFCIPFCSWFFATNTTKKLLWFFIGCAPSVILSAYVLRGGVHEGRALVTGTMEITWENHWCALPYAIALVLMLIYYNSKPIRGYVAALFTGGLNIFMGSRSLGAVMILGAGACFARNVSSHRQVIGRTTLRRLTFVRAIPALIALAFIGVLTLEGYKWAAKRGSLGELARAKYTMQSQGKYGLIGTGRADAFAGLIAIADSPILGYGSWPRDTKGYYLRMCEFFEMKPEQSYYTRGYPLIPSHSHVTQAWVQNGICGGLFWLYVLYVLALSFFRPMAHEQQLRLWACSITMNTAWAVLFSPISDRLTTSLVLAVLSREMVLMARAVPGSFTGGQVAGFDDARPRNDYQRIGA